MKALILISLSIVSLNVFAANVVGEDQKGECEFANQSAKRESKIVVDQPSEEPVAKEAKTISI